MVTDRTLETAPHAAASSDSPAPGQLWQVPTFLLGLIAVAGVCAALPFQKETALSELDRNIATIRHALKHPHEPIEPILVLAQRVVSHTNQELGQSGEAHFLLGSVYQRLADKS